MIEMNKRAQEMKQIIFATGNKDKMRECLKKHGVASPNYAKITSFEGFNSVCHEFQFPVILKPCDNSGSRGVCICKNVEEMKSCFEYAVQYANNGLLLVEDYMVGPEVSVEMFVDGGMIHVLQITDKLTTGAPYFVEMGHSEPSMLSNEIQNEIKATAKDAVLAVGINQGPVHAELIVTKDGPKIVELGARMGGDYITTDLVPLSTGIDMMAATMSMALKMKPDLDRTKNQGACIRFLQSQQGIIESISGFNKIVDLPGYEKHYCTAKCGDVIEEVKNSSNRIGFIIFTGETANEAIERCDAAMKMIEIKYQS